MIATHRDLLLGADCRGTSTRREAPSTATVRNYLIELSRLFALAVKELRVMDTNPAPSDEAGGVEGGRALSVR